MNHANRLLGGDDVELVVALDLDDDLFVSANARTDQLGLLALEIELLAEVACLQAVGEVIAIEVSNPLRIDIAIDAAGSLFGNDGHLDVERIRAELDTAETDLDAVLLFDGGQGGFQIGADFGEVVLGKLFDLLGHLGFLIS